MPERRWLSVSEVARLLGLSTKGLYRLIAQEKIPCGRVGRSLRIDWPALESQLERQAKEQGK